MARRRAAEDQVTKPWPANGPETTPPREPLLDRAQRRRGPHLPRGRAHLTENIWGLAALPPAPTAGSASVPVSSAGPHSKRTAKLPSPRWFGTRVLRSAGHYRDIRVSLMPAP